MLFCGLFDYAVRDLYVQDFTVFGGSLSLVHARKICKVSWRIFMSNSHLIFICQIVSW